MMFGGSTTAGYILLSPVLLGQAVAYDTWCGKYYEPLAPRTPPPPESYFQLPPTSPRDLLDFRCITEKSIYLEDEHVGGVIVDANITRDIGLPYVGGVGSVAQVTMYIGNKVVSQVPVDVQIPSLGIVVPVDLLVESSLKPHHLTCVLTVGDDEYTDKAELYLLPVRRDGGSAVRLDRKTGGAEVNKGRGWVPFFPFGWYDGIDTNEKEVKETSWWDFSAYKDDSGQVKPKTNRQRLEEAKNHGFNIIHPVPPSTTYAPDGDDSAIHEYFTDAEDLGIGIMYDMRHGFTDLGNVKQQVEDFMSKPSLYFWYTADEPDGPTEPLDSTIRSRDVIRETDPYHPVALVLNCQNYFWKEYSSGADILLVDVYSIAMNPLWSKKWNTEITPTFGCSGCDGCQGNFGDLPRRLDQWREWARLSGRGRELPLWMVPQGFDDNGNEFWWRVPEGREVLVQTVLGINHGAVGHCAWLASGSTPDILRNASFIAKQIYSVQNFLIDAADTRKTVHTTLEDQAALGIDIFSWTGRDAKGRLETLLLVAHMHYTPRGTSLDFSPLGIRGRIKTVLFGDVTEQGGVVVFRMERVSVAGVILTEHKDDEVEALSGGYVPLQLPLGLRSEFGIGE